MTRKVVAKRVKWCIRGYFGLAWYYRGYFLRGVLEEDNLFRWGFESISVIDLILCIEQVVGCDLSKEEIVASIKVKDLIDMVAKACGVAS